MNMGLVGALGGLGGGMAGVAEMNLDEAKQMRLEELRTRNNQATNTLNNQQRHDFGMKEAEVGHGYKLEEQAQGNEYSLAQLAQQDAAQTGQIKLRADLEAGAPTAERKNAEFWRDEGNIPLADQYKNSQYNTSIKPPNKVAEGEYLRSIGADEDTIRRHVTGELSPDQLKQKLLVALSKTVYDDQGAQGLASKVDQIVAGMSNGQGGAAPPQKTNARGWKLHVDGNGNRAYVGPNGEIEEL